MFDKFGEFDSVEELNRAAAAQKAEGDEQALVLLAQDASERTARHLRDACEGLVPCRTMPLTAAELAGLTPKPAAVFGVTDENLARLCMSHIE